MWGRAEVRANAFHLMCRIVQEYLHSSSQDSNGPSRSGPNKPAMDTTIPCDGGERIRPAGLSEVNELYYRIWELAATRFDV